jgi:hypothetical protein
MTTLAVNDPRRWLPSDTLTAVLACANPAQREEAASYLAGQMDAEQKARLIAQFPVDYARLFPEIPVQSILDDVRAAIRVAREANH